ncbi:hypothetical protein GCM10028774_03700 [Spirosoma jeollabukense]
MLTSVKTQEKHMENQQPQPTTLDQTDYDSIDFDSATTDDEAAAMESGVELDDDEDEE